MRFVNSIIIITENCLRIGGGVADGFTGRRWLLIPLVIAREPMLRGNVCDLLAVPKPPGRLLTTINFCPEAN